MVFEDQQSSKISQHQYDYVFGTDGAFSKVRKALMKKDRFNYSQDYIPQGYKELCLPCSDDGNFLLEKEALHIWPRKVYVDCTS
ncbi:MAG: hypothetical protein R3A45_07230 [Bdellovibrionota bacterium]